MLYIPGVTIWRRDHFRLLFAGHVEAGSSEGFEVLESGALLLPVEKVARSDAVAIALDL